MAEVTCKIKTNKIRCKLCGDIVESKYTHDFVWCSCGSCAVDGGKDYLKRSYKFPDCYEELSKNENVPSEDE